MNIEQKSRTEIPAQYKWRLEDIFPSDEAWQETFKQVQQQLPHLKAFDGKFSASADQLLAFIRAMHQAQEQSGRLFAYAHMRNDEDKSNSRYQELYDRTLHLMTELNEAVSFFEPQFLQIEETTLQEFYEQQEALKLYEHYFDDILRTRGHTLSAKEERLMALSGEIRNAPEEIFSVWESADIVFPEIDGPDGRPVRLTEALYGKYQQSPDRRLRRDAYMGLYVPFVEHRHMLAANYSAIVKSHLFNTRARGYESSLQAALDANAIPVTIYENLVNSTRRYLQPLHRYNRLRKEILNLKDGVHDYDLRAPLFEQTSREYSWEEAKELCLRGMRPLGKEYLTVLKEGFEQSWIDVFENKGKRTGAYSSGTYGVHPYVLMNYNGTLNDVFTLAHEMGHALHTWYTINNQPFVYGDYPIFLAEVASTANEALLQTHLIEQAANKQEKLAFLNSYLDKFSQTFYRQVIFAEFEWRTHQLLEEGQPLTADRLDDLFAELYVAYHGADFVLDRETKALWSRVPHFYYNFYVFQYSTSFVASTALAAKILKKENGARARYLDFLKSGNSRYPLETLQLAGVDLTQEEPVRITLQWMDKLLDTVEDLLA